jgi:hypothetical protein
VRGGPAQPAEAEAVPAGVILEGLATVGAAIFAGGSLYISIVEHPARMRAGVSVALAQFRQMYRLAAPWQASAAAVSLVCGVLATVVTAEWAWAVGGIVVGLVIPFTVVAMMPINHQLLGPVAPRDDVARALLTWWGKRHWVRSILGAIGLVILVWAAVHR